MTRLEAFQSLRAHPWLGRLFSKLSKTELALAEDFLAANAALDRGAFELALNRLFLDKPKPKNHGAIVELLCCANSSAQEEK